MTIAGVNLATLTPTTTDAVMIEVEHVVALSAGFLLCAGVVVVYVLLEAIGRTRRLNNQDKQLSSEDR